MEIDIEQVAREIGYPVHLWRGNCHGISDAIVQAGALRSLGGPDQKYVVVRGHWIGPRAEHAFFSGTLGLPFVQHSWIEAPGLLMMPPMRQPTRVDPNEVLSDRPALVNPIIDPTRFSFDGKDPYIYVGPNDYYDAGGNAWRSATEAPLPPFNLDHKRFMLELPEETQEWVWQQAKAAGSEYPRKVYTFTLVMWLANLSLPRLGKHARPIFRAIVKAGHAAAIPLDNRLMVLGVDL